VSEILREGPIRVVSEDGGAFWRVVLDRPDANLIDDEMALALIDAFEQAQTCQNLRSILITSAGENFSLGGDPRQMLPPQGASSVRTFHRLVRQVLATPVFLIAVVRGKCFGRGLELAALCNRIYASSDARLGHPEIGLGWIASVASVVLPERIGRAAASELCATRHIKRAEEASWIGLVDHVVESPEQVAVGEIREFLLPLSAHSLHCAMRALDVGFRRRVLAGLDEVESMLDGLLASHDASEGVRALLAGRQPQWRHE
jgi:cyclohexa-1,5-dienecarbonyl-CoA hydratase